MQLKSKTVTLLILLFISACSQHIIPSEAKLRTPLAKDKTIVIGQLGNGLKYYVLKNEKPAKEVEFRLVVNVGSLHETDEQRGAAHFVEHMAFNGSENFSKNDVIEFFRSTGMQFGPDLNATTGYDQTVYKFRIPADKPDLMEKAFLVMKDWASGIRFNQDDVDSERNIIIEEWRMRKGAWERSWKKFMPTIYNHSRHAKRHPIGTIDILGKISAAELKYFYDTWYRPERMAIMIIGDISETTMAEKIRSKFGNLKNSGARPKTIDYEIPPHKQLVYQAVQDPEMTDPSILIYQKYKRNPIVTEGDFRLKLMNDLYVSILHRRINTKDPLERSYKDANYKQFELSPDVACHFFHISVKGRQFEKNLYEIVQEAERLKRFGVFESELEREKKVILRKAKSAYLERQNKRSDQYAKEMVQHTYLGDRIISDEVHYRLTEEYLPTINISDINNLRGLYNSSSGRVVGIFTGPGASEKLPDEASVKKMFLTVQQERLAPYLDEVSDLPLFPEQLEKGSIIKETVYEEIGVTVWELSNGGKVYLKPTDFKDDEILFGLSSSGGLALLKKEDIRTIYLMGKVVEKSGIGPFKRSDLIKRLIFKKMDIKPFTSPYRHGYWGSTSPEDFIVLVKMMRLMLTQPGFDDEIFKEEKEDLIEQLEEKQQTANWRYWQAIRTKLTSDNPYNKLVTAAEIEKLDAKVTRESLFELLQNRGEFSLVVVGAFTIEAVRPIIETYIASYPRSLNPPEIKDLKLNPVSGEHHYELNENIEDKSHIFIRISHEFDYSLKRSMRFWALAQAAQIRIDQELREKEGLIYHGSAMGNFTYAPNTTDSNFYFNFDCAPQNVDRVISGLREILRELKETPPSVEMIDNIIKTQRNALRKAIKTNSYWQRYLSVQISFIQNLEDIDRIETYIETLTPENFQEAAKNYLNEKNFFIYTLNPK